MRVKIGQLQTRVVVIKDPMRGSRLVELSKSMKVITQTWDCQTQTSNPAKPIRSFDAQTNLLFLAYDARGRVSKTLGNRLAVRFLNAAGFANGKALNTQLQQLFGSKKISIPYDALLLQNRNESKVLRSYLQYADVALEFRGRQRNEEVILSVPLFVLHHLFITGRCTEFAFTPVTPGSLGPIPDKVRRENIKTRPKNGKDVVKMYFRDRIARAEEEGLRRYAEELRQEMRVYFEGG